MTQSINPMGARTGQAGAKKDVYVDLMRSGPGTPWENRGEHGLLGAFIKTCLGVMTKPGQTLDSIRATTVTDDARRFAWICIALWGVGSLVQSVVTYLLIDQKAYVIDTTIYLLRSVVFAAVVAGWVFLMLRFFAGLYHKLVITETKGNLSTSLTYNISAYCLAPSVLAVLPLLGPPLAGVWIFIALIAGGRKRLRMSWRGAIIDALIPFIIVAVLTGLLIFVGNLLWNLSLDPLSEVIKPQVKPGLRR